MNLPLQILVKNIFFHAKVMPINIQAVLEPLGIYRDVGKRPSRDPGFMHCVRCDLR